MGWLSKFILSAGGIKVPDIEDVQPELYEQNSGIYLLSNCDDAYQQISSKIDSSIIKDLINSLDWESGFYQVICTLEPGILIEVGGSLNEYDGLAGIYKNRLENIEAVTIEPPETKSEMIEIMQSFSSGSNVWHTKYSWGEVFV